MAIKLHRLLAMPLALLAVAVCLSAAQQIAGAQNDKPAANAQANPPLPKPDPKELIVLPFSPDADVMLRKTLEEQKTNKVSFGLELSSILIQNLLHEGYSVLARDQLQALLEERHLMDTGLVKEETGREIGQYVGAKYLLWCSITGFRAYQPYGQFGPTVGEVEISGRIVEVATGNYLPISLVVTGRKEVKNSPFTSIAQYLANTLFKGDQWLNGSLLGDAARLAVAAMARKYLLVVVDGGTDVSTIDARDKTLVIEKGTTRKAMRGEAYTIFRIDQKKDKNGKVVFERPVKVIQAEVTGLNRGAAMLKIVATEPQVKLPDLARDRDGGVPFFALPSTSPRVAELDEESKADETTASGATAR